MNGIDSYLEFSLGMTTAVVKKRGWDSRVEFLPTAEQGRDVSGASSDQREGAVVDVQN